MENNKLLKNENSDIAPKEAAKEIILNDPDVEVVNDDAYNIKLAEQVAQLEKLGIDPKTLKRFKKIPFKRTEPKIGRNEKCPCGSGKKYKHCCLKN